MNSFQTSLLCVLAVTAFGGCALDEAEPRDETGEAEQAVFSYHPMGFARVSAAGGVVTAFNKAGGAVAVTPHPPGEYIVTFRGLGVPVAGDASTGHVQVTAEGAGNARCFVASWFGAPDLIVRVLCSKPDGSRAESGFAIQYHRYRMPAPSTRPTSSAYTLVDRDGSISPLFDYNSSGVHNTATRTGAGRYTIHLPNAAAVNASMMVTPHNFDWAGPTCSIQWWGAGTADVECRDRFGALADSKFLFSYAVSGPTLDQQGAHAWFNGTAAHPTYSAALGRVSWCSPATVSGSRTGSEVTMVVSGDLGAWDGGPFLRASFASKYGAAGYCKIESLTSAGVAPTSNATTKIRCYSATGEVVEVPKLTFTHVTSDVTGPC